MYAIRIVVTEIDEEKVYAHDVLDIAVCEREIPLPLAITLGQRIVRWATKMLEKN